MAKLNKSQFIELLAEKAGSSKAEAKKFLEAFQAAVVEGLLAKPKTEAKIALSGFANIEIKKRKARTMRNPQTGATMKVPAKRVLKLTALKALKTAVL